MIVSRLVTICGPGLIGWRINVMMVHSYLVGQVSLAVVAVLVW